MTVALEAPIPVSAAMRRSLQWRQATVLALLFGGYASLDFCRADLAVATPLLDEALDRKGVSHGDAIIRIGQIASLGCWPTDL